jgi:hypothetical protein
MDRLVEKAADRARNEPGFLGWVFDVYQAHFELDDARLADQVGCSETDLARLALCRLPRADQFHDDVTRIAARVDADPLQIASVIRICQALDRLQQSNLASDLLKAARRDDEPRSNPRE